MGASDVVEQIRMVRQARLFHDEPVPQDVIDQLLEVARWTGSARNVQAWHFIVVQNKETLKTLSEARDGINWVAGAPLAIALVFNGEQPVFEGYDEGRVTERLLIAAKLLGYGGGTAWYLTDDEKKIAYDALKVPADKSLRSIVVIGRPTTTKDHRPNSNIPGRKPLSEIVSHETYGNSASS
jgi:nitroreductase